MLIECTIKRTANRSDPNEGTLVALPNYDPTGELIESETEYRFAPRDGDPRHCCIVDDEMHRRMLLAVRPTYRKAASLSDSEKSTIASRPNTVVFSEPRPRPAGAPKPILQVVESEPDDEPESAIEDLRPERVEAEGPLDKTFLELATVTEIQTHCATLSNEELVELEEWEMDHKNRQGVFNAIRTVLKARAAADEPNSATA